MEIDFLGLGGTNTNPGIGKDDVVGVGSMDSAAAAATTLAAPPGYDFLRHTAEPSSSSSAIPTQMQMEMQGRSFSDKLSKSSWMSSFQSPREANPPSCPSQKNVLDVPAQRFCKANGFPPWQLLARPLGSNHEPRKFPVSTHPGQVIVSSPLTKPRPPVLNSMLLPAACHTATFPVSYPQIGSPVPRDTGSPISPGAISQLTIFFAGSVSVYDDVSPEKAEAILSMARSSSSASPSKSVTVTQIQSQPLRHSLDGVLGGKSPSMLPSSSPSLVNTQPVNNTKQSIMTAPTLVQAVAIPQARKVSLARFLERRKERMVNASPYGSNKRSLERGGVPSADLGCSGAEFHGKNPQL
ncbi:hypothetical protein MLD38_024031 [Melastoma candidum]|uniref:Uncharacterized protein n=1 Tax=Melastoma candidum TaxID=119954 RepID=A0ACB9NW08_9MYRT|nr:hypothetical protein MLD38_024031 [Melastoma candidum]